MDANTNEVVTLLLVNGAGASASDLAAQYQDAGITTNLAYAPSSETSSRQQWPTLQDMINSGQRLVNFVESITYDTDAPYLMDEWTYPAAMGTARPYLVTAVPVKLDSEGMSAVDLEHILSTWDESARGGMKRQVTRQLHWVQFS